MSSQLINVADYERVAAERLDAGPLGYFAGGAGDEIPDESFITARDRHVIIIGGGDTGADCLGTAHRHGCASIHQFEIVPRPPDDRATSNPWPQWSNTWPWGLANPYGT